jgi:hypothetical protein
LQEAQEDVERLVLQFYSKALFSQFAGAPVHFKGAKPQSFFGLGRIGHDAGGLLPSPPNHFTTSPL